MAKRTYVKKSCHYKKSDAKKSQKKMHNMGMTAKLVKTKVGKKVKYCVMSAGKRK
jgi:hypothetical protein|tara:strand:+ start:4706 stop:4870 length:165 start_codon:yes stop_codon:yes gene_type:complete